MNTPAIVHLGRRSQPLTLHLRLLGLAFACLFTTGCGFIDWLGGRGLSPDYCSVGFGP